MQHFSTHNADFTCQHCRRYVSADTFLAGAQNRNHCPYCLWSRHLDQFEPGDRLAACKAGMRPVALSVKRSRKKYVSRSGELMLVHQCTGCGKVSINRIAADDIADYVFEVYEASLRLPTPMLDQMREGGVDVLGVDDEPLARLRLFGGLEQETYLSEIG